MLQADGPVLAWGHRVEVAEQGDRRPVGPPGPRGRDQAVAVADDLVRVEVLEQAVFDVVADRRLVAGHRRDPHQLQGRVDEGLLDARRLRR